ncbi:MAG TPA: PAS domain S-box protein [Solirubrobacterales bacterium]|nr:PAS domain S-box protein [Solirubrobacterales bacterium]
MSTHDQARAATDSELQQLWQLSFQKTTRGISIADADDRLVAVNPAFARMHGGTADDFIGRHRRSLFPPEITPRLELAAEELEQEDFVAFEGERLRLDGSTFLAAMEAMLIRGQDGELLYRIAWFTDLSQRSLEIVSAQDIYLRKRMEEETTGIAPGAAIERDLMCMVSEEGRIVRLEGDWREVLGWERAELVGRELGEYVHSDDRESAVAELVGLARIESGWRTVRLRFRTRNGSWSWLSWSALGQADGRVACAVREVNERVAIEQVLDLRGEMIANMGEGVCLVTTGNERIVFANPSLERMLGYAPGELVGRRALDVMMPGDLTPDEEVEREEARRCLQEQGHCIYEGRRVRRDGTSIWCRTTTTTFEHPRYGPVWVAVQQDVTEERRAHQAAAELERAKSEFLGSVSHELRTPLTSILGYAALLREDTEGIVDAGNHIDVIERNAGRQLRLVEDLLSIARIQAGEFEVHRLPLDFAELVRLGVEAMRPAAKEADLRLELDCDGSARVLGDADRLDQVLANLLANAIKFTPRGGRVAVALQTTPEEAVLTVADTGPGIPQQEREHLFDRLFRGDDVKRLRVSGAGLGLTIARSIIEAHEGTIEAHDGSREAGATFELTLPLLKAP